MRRYEAVLVALLSFLQGRAGLLTESLLRDKVRVVLAQPRFVLIRKVHQEDGELQLCLCPGGAGVGAFPSDPVLDTEPFLSVLMCASKQVSELKMVDPLFGDPLICNHRVLRSISTGWQHGTVSVVCQTATLLTPPPP